MQCQVIVVLYFTLRQSHMFDEAVKHFRSSLKCNPYLWSSFEALCHLGMII